MTALYGKDYNELTKEFPEEWKRRTRRNIYRFELKDKSSKRLRYFCEMYQAKSLIDYGCGYATYYLPSDVKVFRYDPFIEEYSIKPTEAADLVVSYNVLNVIEPDYIEPVLKDIYSLTKKAFVCNIRIPGFWLKEPKQYIETVSKMFHIVDNSYTKSVVGDRFNLYLLLEKREIS